MQESLVGCQIRNPTCCRCCRTSQAVSRRQWPAAGRWWWFEGVWPPLDGNFPRTPGRQRIPLGKWTQRSSSQHPGHPPSGSSGAQGKRPAGLPGCRPDVAGSSLQPPPLPASTSSSVAGDGGLADSEGSLALAWCALSGPRQHQHAPPVGSPAPPVQGWDQRLAGGGTPAPRPTSPSAGPHTAAPRPSPSACSSPGLHWSWGLHLRMSTIRGSRREGGWGRGWECGWD